MASPFDPAAYASNPGSRPADDDYLLRPISPPPQLQVVPVPGLSSYGDDTRERERKVLSNMPTPLSRISECWGPRRVQTQLQRVDPQDRRAINPFSLFINEGRNSADPRYLAPSTASVLRSQSEMDKFGLSLTISATPLADPGPSEASVPVVDLTLPSSYRGSPERCKKCGAFLSQFNVAAPSSYQCFICGSENTYPGDMIEIARQKKLPSQQNGVVEYIVNDPVWAPSITPERTCDTDIPSPIVLARELGPPPPLTRGNSGDKAMLLPRFCDLRVFVIDASATAVQGGLYGAAISSLRHVLPQLPLTTRLAFVFSGSHVCVPYLARLQGRRNGDMVVPFAYIADNMNPFSPLTIREAAPRIEDVPIDSWLESMAQIGPYMMDQSGNESALGVAMAVAVDLAAPLAGSRITVLASQSPTLGAGAIPKKHKATQRSTGEESARKKVPSPIFASPDPFYVSLAEKCVQFFVSVDLFALGSGQLELVSLGYLSQRTCGDVWHFPYLGETPAGALEALSVSFQRSLVRATGHAATLTINCSRPFAVSRFLGFEKSGATCRLVGIDSDKSITVRIRATDRVSQDKAVVYFQSVLQYTARDGSRRVRVANICLPVVQRPSEFYRTIDHTVLLTGMIRGALSKARFKHSLTGAKQSLNTQLVSQLHGYRTSIVSGPICDRFYIHRQMDWVPLMVLSALRRPCFASEKKELLNGKYMKIPSQDAREADMQLLFHLPPRSLARLLYPQWYDLLSIVENDIYGQPMNSVWEDTQGSAMADLPALPRVEVCSSSLLPRPLEQGIWFIGLPTICFIYIGSEVSESDALQIVASPFSGLYRVPNNSNAQRLHNVIAALCWTAGDSRDLAPPCIVVTSSDTLSPIIPMLLIEDSNIFGPSYPQFISLLNKDVLHRSNIT